MTQIRIPWTTARSIIGEITAGHFITAVKDVHHTYRLDLRTSKLLVDALRDGHFTFETLDGTQHVVIQVDVIRITFT